MDIKKIKDDFERRFGVAPLLIRSPGRINIIGEHTDYNGGFVLPAAINKAIYVAVSHRADDKILLYAENYNQEHASTLTTLAISDKGWPNYILGVVDQLLKRGLKVGGFNLLIDGNVPLGAGLSSSAAVECATAYALDQLFDLKCSRMDIAFIAQKAEHTFAGVNCGIMDQFASVFGKQDHAVLLDCRNMDYNYVPLDLEGYKLVLFNTNVKHALAETAYNNRRAQCEQGVAWVKEHHPEVNLLRDVTHAQLEAYVQPKDEDVYVKCRFIVQENDRVQRAISDLKNGDLAGLGKCMFEAHEGLSKEYEVSCRELDFLVHAVKMETEVAGARMMGGGFGGCTINIIKNDAIARIIEEISTLYHAEFGLTLDAYIVETGEGTTVIG